MVVVMGMVVIEKNSGRGRNSGCGIDVGREDDTSGSGTEEETDTEWVPETFSSESSEEDRSEDEGPHGSKEANLVDKLLNWSLSPNGGIKAP